MKVQALLTTVNGKSITDTVFEIVGKDNGPIPADFEAFPLAGGLKRLGIKIAKKAADVVEGLGDNTVNNLLDKFKNLITRIISENLKKNGIDVQINAEQITKEGNNLKIDFSVSEIDYISIANRFLPIVLDKYISKDENNCLNKIVNVIGDDKDKIIIDILNTLSDDKKEQIISLLAVEYQNVICEKLTEFLKEQNVNFTVNKLIIENN